MKQNNSIYKSPQGKELILDIYREKLSVWPVPFEEITVETRFGPTFVLACGNEKGTPLILLHGSTSNSTAWISEVEELGRYFRILAVDLPGEPGRSSEIRPEWEGPAFAEWLKDVCNALLLDKVSLMGISQGGWTALKFAVENPERVSSLILLATGGVAPVRASFMLRAIPLTFFGRKGAEMINKITFGQQPIHPEAFRIMNIIMNNYKPRIGPQQIYSDEELNRLDMPVYFIGGLQDALIDCRKTADRLRRTVKNVTVELLPDFGHVLVGMAPRVVSFCKKNDSNKEDDLLTAYENNR